ncbi:MAG TPA: flippase [Actinomycetota bacterium]|nr:flippase [Actinomycetota bacterium]
MSRRGRRPAAGERHPTDSAAADREVLGMARGGSLNFAGLATSQAATFVISLLLARSLGRSDLGVYAQAFAVLSLLQMVAMGGLHTGTMRFVAVHRASGNRGAVHGTILLGLGAALGLSAVIGLTLYALAPWMAGSMFSEDELTQPLRAVALALPAATFSGVALGATQGFKTMRASATIGLILEPALRLLLTAATVAAGWGVGGAMVSVVTSNYVAAILAARALRRLAGRAGGEAAFQPRELFSFSSVSWLGSLANSGLIWTDTVILGIYLPSAQVGVYSVATRLVVLASLFQTAINSALGPRIADLYQRQEHSALERAYRAAANWTVRLALPAFAILVLFPQDLLSLFGNGFAAAGAVTALLALGKLVDAVTGPCALMLNMSGRPLVNTVNNLAVLALNIALNVLLVPRFGLLGAAAAWTVSLAGVNVARVVEVWVTMRMWPFGIAMLKGLAAVAVGAVPAYFAGRALAGIPGLAAGAGALVLVYLALVWMLGITAEDRLVFSALRRRTGAVKA